MRNTKLLTMIEGAVIAAVCTALSFVPLNTANAAFDLSLGLIPLGVYALRRGLVPGMAVGFVWGLLLMALGKAYFLTIPQILLEYPVAFAFGGFGGIFAGRLKGKLAAGATNTTAISTNGSASIEAGVIIGEKTGEDAKSIANNAARTVAASAIKTVVLAGICTAAARWFFHFWAGVIFWGSYAPEGMNPFLYSFIFNGASAAANAAMLAAVLTVILRAARPLFIPKDT